MVRRTAATVASVARRLVSQDSGGEPGYLLNALFKSSTVGVAICDSTTSVLCDQRCIGLYERSTRSVSSWQDHPCRSRQRCRQNSTRLRACFCDRSATSELQGDCGIALPRCSRSLERKLFPD